MRLLLFAFIVLLTPASAPAQELPRLHITVLSMQADRAVVAAGQLFHLTIHVRVTERRPRLDELVLPTLTNATDLGDERRRTAGPKGTDFYEVVTVSADQPGTASFTPATIDAIDPRTGRALRYSSNPVSIRVTSGPTIDAVSRSIGSTLRPMLQLALAVVLVAGVVLAGLLLLLVRRRRPPIAVAPAPVAVPVFAISPAVDPLRAALATFRAQGDDPSLDALREQLFRRAGAAPGATLADALRVLGGRQPELARAIAVAERARFGPTRERAAATRDLLGLMDELLAARETNR